MLVYMLSDQWQSVAITVKPVGQDGRPSPDGEVEASLRRKRTGSDCESSGTLTVTG